MTRKQKTSALPVAVAGAVMSTRPTVCAIREATLLRVATGGTVIHKGRGAGE